MKTSGDLIEAARRAVATGEAVGGLDRLHGGLTHDVFSAELSGQRVAVKVYRSWDRREPDCEWQALCALAEFDLGPEPICCSPADGEKPPVVVMGWVTGHSRQASDLRPQDLAILVGAHRAVHRVSVDSPHKTNAPSVSMLVKSREMMSSWNETAPHLRAQPVEVRAAGAAVLQWLQTDGSDLVASSPMVFGRGDPNLANYLWTEGHLTMIDFEDAGLTCPGFELADFFEHASSRALPETYWPLLCDLYGQDQTERAHTRRLRNLVACFWLGVLHRRAIRGAKPVNLTLPEQAQRVLELLG